MENLNLSPISRRSSQSSFHQLPEKTKHCNSDSQEKKTLLRKFQPKKIELSQEEGLMRNSNYFVKSKKLSIDISSMKTMKNSQRKKLILF
jgi:hypothetical protein